MWYVEYWSSEDDGWYLAEACASMRVAREVAREWRAAAYLVRVIHNGRISYAV